MLLLQDGSESFLAAKLGIATVVVAAGTSAAIIAAAAAVSITVAALALLPVIVAVIAATVKLEFVGTLWRETIFIAEAGCTVAYKGGIGKFQFTFCNAVQFLADAVIMNQFFMPGAVG